MSHRVEELTALRAIVGNEAREGDLSALLDRHGGDVNAAVNAYFDSGIAGGSAALHPTPVAPPVAQPVAQQTVLLSVEVPQGVSPGQEVQVQTEAGLMRVTVPQGITSGQTFLMRCPAVVHPTMPQTQGLGGYPGQQHQSLQGYTQRPQRTVHVVRGAPYYRGYGGYDAC